MLEHEKWIDACLRKDVSVSAVSVKLQCTRDGAIHDVACSTTEDVVRVKAWAQRHGVNGINAFVVGDK